MAKGEARIFVNLFTNIGDVVCFTPLLRWLRQARPDAEIVACTSSVGKQILATNPNIDEVVLPPKGSLGKIGQVLWLKRRGFDTAILARTHNPTVLNARLAGIPRRIGFADAKRPTLLTDVLVPVAGRRRIDGLSVAIAQQLEIVPDDLGTELPIDDGARARANQVLDGVRDNERLVAFHCGATMPSKVWPIERMRQVWETLADHGVRCVVIGGAEDRQTAQDQIRLSSKPPILLAGRLGLLETAAVLERSALLVSNDSGPMHMAAAVGTRVVSAFGPTRIEDYGPSGSGHCLLQAACQCPEPKTSSCSGCIRAIEAEQVISGAIELLKTDASEWPPQSLRGRTDTPPMSSSA